ncbi:sulfotransferase domain-containing protein [Microbulbifer agarilyticus]|uniref:sulfotransferase domain-containing protein n=1 Tax=Microbulbifer agarilyticus TaxID=260552 RepID=UPI001CD3710E|nr:sulfotransferase domain-containing protein [Microbulbifer agarilyticus]MCA0893704.1 sulfotransferase domain-containing protein [Microbulbifer agarilyticus]
MDTYSPTIELNRQIASRGSKTICILGTPRSGTSMIAGVVRQLGIDMGQNIGSGNNEDQDFLIHQGHRQIFSDQSEKKKYLDEIRKCIEKRNLRTPEWGWKDPLSSYYIADLASELRNLHVILVWRDAVATTQGENRFRQQQSIPLTRERTLASLMNIHNEYNNMLQFIQTTKANVLLVSYEKFLLKKTKGITEIANFLEVPLMESSMNKIVEYISPERGTAAIT